MSNNLQAVKAVPTRSRKITCPDTGKKYPVDSHMGIAVADEIRFRRGSKRKQLGDLIPAPKGQATRHMLSVGTPAYDYITGAADELGCSRGKIVQALIDFYRNK